MDIFVPKFEPERYVREPLVMRAGMYGEYRATLTRADGSVKYCSGWRPNHILDQGLYRIVENSYDYATNWAIGDSGAATANAQIGIVGNVLAQNVNPSLVGYQNATSPNWESYVTESCVFAPGVGTGTVREVVLHYGFNRAADQGTIRFVLDTPIVKGVYDQLTIEHKQWSWPEIADVTGVLTITGDQDYDYTLRYFEIDNNGLGLTRGKQGDILFGDVPSYGGLLAELRDAALVAIDANITCTDARPSSAPYTIGGTAPNYYREVDVTWGIDNGNGSWTRAAAATTTNNSPYVRSGIQWSLARTSDAGPLVKANTHELIMTYRLQIDRYVP